MQLENELLVDTRHSSWQNRQVRTIIVNSRSKLASQRSISAAIAAAKPFDRIELVGGEYFETISIPFPIELVASEGEDVCISFRGTCLTAAIDCAAYVSNIQFCSKGKQRNDFAVVVTAGLVELSRCIISSCLISGKGKPTLHRCTIKESLNGVGLRVADAGGGLIDNCDITNHACACVEVDTVGSLIVRNCTIAQPNSSLTAVAVQAVSSNATQYTDVDMAPDGRHPGICCRLVRFVDNRISVREGVPYADAIATQSAALGMIATSAGAPIPVLSTFGEPCCALVSYSAQPLFERNEFAEGSVGIIFERLGCAVLKGNVFRLQRRCGIFFLLPELDHQHHNDDWAVRSSVKISEHNFFDRCRIGIDVQCGSTGAKAIHADTAPACPVDRSGHSWVAGLQEFHERRLKEIPQGNEVFLSHSTSLSGRRVTSPGDHVVDVAAACGSSEPLRATSGALSEYLLSVVEDVMLAHPRVTRHVRQSAQGTSGTPSGYLATTHTGATFGFLTALLGDPAVYRQSLRRIDQNTKNERVAKSSLELLRGGFGIHIVDARFINCTLCGVRFGTNGRGLVDGCEFDRCGSSAILVESGGVPMIVGCSFQNNGECAIMARTYANPLIVCNVFDASSAHGIAMKQYSRGLILGNVVSGSEGFGIDVSFASSTLIAHNFITRNKEGGVRARHSSRPLLLSNQLTGNFGAQVQVTDFAVPSILCNTIISGGSVGVHFSNCGSGNILGNRITFQTNEGIRIELDADPCIEGNIIASNKGHGVLVKNDGGGTITKNVFEANELYNIRLEEGGSTVIRGNEIVGGFLGGVSAAEEATGLVEKNFINKNGLANVSIRGEHTNPQILSNDIGECHSGVGILCEDLCGGIIIGNLIHGNKTSGIMTRSHASPTIQRNRFINETAGIVFSDSGKGLLEHNEIYDLHGTGVILQRNANPVVRHNTVTACALSGMLITPDAFGSVYENKISSCGIGMINGNAGNSGDVAAVTETDPVADAAPPKRPRPAGKSAQVAAAPLPTATLVSKNTISECKECGILCESGANAVFSENRIVDNSHFGILCDVSYRADRIAQLAAAAKRRAAQQQQVGGAASAGLQWWELASPGAAAGSGGGAAVFSKNTICRHTTANIASIQHPSNNFRVTQNKISEAPCGVLVRNSSTIFEVSDNDLTFLHEAFAFEASGRGHVLHNRIKKCAFCSVYIASGGDPLVEQNTIEDCGSSAILCDAGSKGTIRGNTLSRCVVGVTVVTSPGAGGGRGGSHLSLSSTTLVERNTIHENELHGVLVLNSSYAFPVRQLRRIISGSEMYHATHQGDGASSDQQPQGTSKHEWQAELQKFYQSVGEGERGFPIIRDNKIFRNRFCGVLREKFHMLDLPDEDPRRFASEGADEDGTRGGGSTTATPEKQRFHHKDTKKVHQTIQSPLTNNAAAKRRAGKVQQQGASTRAGSEPSGVDGTAQNDEYDTEPHFHSRALALPSLIANDVYENSFGIVVGQEMDLFVLRCRVHHNSFFGILIRSTGSPEVQRSTIEDNGLAGIYAAKFCGGHIQETIISSNNFLCRDAAMVDQPRSIATFVASSHFVSLITSDDGWLDSAAKSTTPEGQLILAETMTGMVNAHRQVTTMCDVHLTVLDGACSILSDVVSAPSDALTIASSILPNPYYASASQSVDTVLAKATSASSSPARSSSSHQSPLSRSNASSPKRTTRTLSLASTIAAEYSTTPISDGGIGVWMEEGSQIRVTDSTITKHQHCGALFSRGLLAHHHVLRQAEHNRAKDFHLSAKKQPSSGVFNSTSRFASPNPGVLFTHQTFINNNATTGADMTHILDRTTTHLDATSLSSGLVSVTASPARPHALSGSPQAALMAASFGASSSTLGLSGVHLPTSGAPVLQRNSIHDNMGDGVRVQLFHAMVATSIAGSQSTVTANATPAASTAPTTKVVTSGKEVPGKKTRRSASTASIVDAPATTSEPSFVAARQHRGNIPLPHLFDNDVASLQFSLVVEDNDIRHNGLRGVLCEHVSEINCTSAIPSRSALIERFEDQSAHLTSRVEGTLRRGSDVGRAVRAQQTVRLIVEAGRLSNAKHANIRVNQFSLNQQAHVECVSRFVAYTGDKHRTLLHVDGQLDPVAAGSMFGFANLMKVPLMNDLTNCPPPGICLIDGNRFADAPVGLYCCGVLPSQATRVRGNIFTQHEKAGVLVDGPRAAVCVGDGNVFERNHVGIYFYRSIGSSFVPDPSAPQAAGRCVDEDDDALNRTYNAVSIPKGDFVGNGGGPSRIFKNTFRSNSFASVLVETLTAMSSKDAMESPATFAPSIPYSLLLPPPVVFKNLFEVHDAESAGVVVVGPCAAAWVTTNTFRQNVVGLLGGNSCGTSGVASTASASSATKAASRSLLVEHNKFEYNSVGLVAASGAAAILLSNYFQRNAWCGAAIVDRRTTVTMRDCVFDEHVSALNPNCAAATANRSDLECARAASDAQAITEKLLVDYLRRIPSANAKVSWSLRPCGTVGLHVHLPHPLSLMQGTDAPHTVDWGRAGLVIDPTCSATIENSLFTSNEVGIDVLRDVVPAWCDAYAAGLSDPAEFAGVAPQLGGGVGAVKVNQCAFRANALAGAHIRGHPGRRETTYPPLSTASPQIAARKARAAHADAAQSLDGTSSVLMDGCIFEETSTAFHSCITSSIAAQVLSKRSALIIPAAMAGSDVVFRWFGHAEVRGCVLHNVVHASDDGYGVVRACVIASRTSFSHIGVILAAGGRTSVIQNLLRDKHVCVRACSSSHGLVENNLMTNASIGIDTDANCSTTFQQNTVALMGDCCATVRGGFVLQNTFTASPVGVVLRPVEIGGATRGGNKSKEDVGIAGNYELKLAENVIHSCDGDGILVGGGGLVEGNHVYNNKTNVNVVFSASMDTVGSSGGQQPAEPLPSSIPRISQNFIFDGQFGVVLTNNSVCFLANNDVFDNAISGVVCQETATGVVENNRISSAMNQGALEIAPACQCQIYHNNVRNQFSPAYNKGLSHQRTKLMQKESQRFAVVLGEADEKLSASQADGKVLCVAMTRLYQRLVAGVHDASSTDDYATTKATQLPRSASLGRGRALSFSRFDDATAPLANLRGDAQTDGDERTLSKKGRSQSALGRVRSLQQLRKDANGGQDTRGSATAANILRGASKERQKAQQESNSGSGQNSRSTTPTAKGKRSQSPSSHGELRVLFHALHGRDSGFTPPPDASGDQTPSRLLSTLPSPQTTPRRSATTNQSRQMLSEALNVLRGAFHHSTTPATVMVTEDATSAASAIKSQSPNFVIFVLTDPLEDVPSPPLAVPQLPPVNSPRQLPSDHTLPAPANTSDSLLSQSDEKSLVKISRLLQSLKSPSGPLKPLLVVHQSYERCFLAGAGGSSTSKRSRTSIGAASQLLLQPLHMLTFQEFATHFCQVITFDTMDDLEDIAVPTMLSLVAAQAPPPVPAPPPRADDGIASKKTKKPPTASTTNVKSNTTGDNSRSQNARTSSATRSRSSSPAVLVKKVVP